APAPGQTGSSGESRTSAAVKSASAKAPAVSAVAEEALGSKLPPLELPSYQGNENLARRPFGPGKSARWERVPRARGKRGAPSGPETDHKPLNKDGVLDPDEM